MFVKRVGICYHPKLADGLSVAERLRAAIGEAAEVWIASAWDEEALRAAMGGVDLVVSVGGDGTVLRTARAAAGTKAAILGVNMGRLGFLTELDVESAVGLMPEIVAGTGVVDERSMLSVVATAPGWESDLRTHVLNDIVVGRSSLGRTIAVEVLVDGVQVAELHGDGVIVATATGSTAYSLSVGGPILNPLSREILVSPLAPHLAASNSLVLQPGADLVLRLPGHQRAGLSADGAGEIELPGGASVDAKVDGEVVRYLRIGEQMDFYRRVARRLNWLQ